MGGSSAARADHNCCMQNNTTTTTIVSATVATKYSCCFNRKSCATDVRKATSLAALWHNECWQRQRQRQQQPKQDLEQSKRTHFATRVQPLTVSNSGNTNIHCQLSFIIEKEANCHVSSSSSSSTSSTNKGSNIIDTSVLLLLYATNYTLMVSLHEHSGNSNSNNMSSAIIAANTRNTNSISSNSSSIMSVATALASTALAALPTDYVPLTSSTTPMEPLMPLNQSSMDKVELIEMDLANETAFSAYPALRHYHGDYDVSYIARINPFWLQFEPPNTRTYYIMAIIYIIISSVGCLGNALVIFMFIRCKSLRTPANTLVINLAVSDLIMLVKCPIAIYNNFKQGPALGDIGCRIYGFVGGLSGTTSIGTLTAIALDRYNVVVYPLDPLRKTAKLRPPFVISFIWIYSFMFSVVPALNIGLSVYVPEGFLTTCSFDYLDKETGPRVFMFLFFVAGWCLPFGIICFSYFYILKVVFAANRIQSSKDKNKTEHKLAMIVVGIIGLWFLAWTPYAVVAMLGVFGMEQYITPLGSMIPALFCKTAACIDPYIYAATHPRFRMEFRRLLGGRGHLRRSSTTRSSYLTRSSTRRLRVISDVDMRQRTGDNTKNNHLTAVPEVTEESGEREVTIERVRCISSRVEQSRF